MEKQLSKQEKANLRKARRQQRRIFGFRISLARLAALVVLAGIAATIVAGLFVYFVGISGLSTDRVRGQVEAAAERLLARDVEAELGPAQISFDGVRLVSVEIDDVRLTAKGPKPVDVVTAKNIRLGVRTAPLATGNIRLGSARISDAVIFAAALPVDRDLRWMTVLTRADGLADPDSITDAVFSAVHYLFDAFEADTTRSVELENVEIVLGEGSAMRSIMISRASLNLSFTGRLSFSAATVADGREVAIEAMARLGALSHRIDNLDLSVLSVPVETMPTPIPISTPATATPEAGVARDTAIGKLDLHISGKEGRGGAPSRLDIALEVGDTIIRVGPRNDIDMALNIVAELVSGTGKLEISRGRITSGRSWFDFSGAIGPKPRSDPAETALYRYEFVSNQVSLAPPDSPEAALMLGGRLAGTFDPVSARLDNDEIVIRTSGGEVLGTAAFELAKGKVPGMVLFLLVPKMPTAHVKQIWPWIAASGARRWALANLFDGSVSNGHIQLRVPPGRLGNGIPLTGDEVSGHFEVAGTRFDVAGSIPPVRDAAGAIDFSGNDVDITLSSGTIYLPGGGSVKGSNGRMEIRKDSEARIMGALDVDVVGEAKDITELASYEPIDAMSKAGMKSAEFSGRVSGNVKADIPLNAAARGGKPNWLVSLDFTDLALSRAIFGQWVSAADGNIVLDPEKAVITAQAQLNGSPAKIDLIEPFGDSTQPRRHKVEISLDDKARDKIAPGLAELLDGPVTLRYETDGSATRQVEMDLTGAKFDLPWIGWSKGPGIAATASFTQAISGNRMTLSNFRLSGKSFAATGNIVINGGELSSARFDRVQLNRGDEVSVVLNRSGDGYTIDVTGAALDARSLIKRVTLDKAGAASGGRSPAVKVNADIKGLVGFNGALLSDVRLAYSGTAERVAGLRFSATTATGGRVVITDATNDGRRVLEMVSSDAGSVLRFLDLYQHMEGGAISLMLSGENGQPMRGKIDASNFWVVNEPKLASLVSTPPPGTAQSLNQAVRANIDASRVQFERGYAKIRKTPGSLLIEQGVLRGPLIGLIFQGTLYDEATNINMTGTFMPAYGLNRIFGEIPILGQILGNGNDRGLIGVTFRLAGKSSAPVLQINPLSAVAPGIFRSIFEFR